tara:strand:+ start:169 stop:300 length:132 start_codon:yes stop_codon:yes gene_type:complete
MRYWRIYFDIQLLEAKSMKILLVGNSGFLGAWVAHFLNINQEF